MGMKMCRVQACVGLAKVCHVSFCLHSIVAFQLPYFFFFPMVPQVEEKRSVGSREGSTTRFSEEASSGCEDSEHSGASTSASDSGSGSSVE